MGDHRGLRVAVKVLRVYLTTDFAKVRMVRCVFVAPSIHVCTLTLTRVEVLQGGHHLGNSSPSERVTTARSDDERLPIYNGVGMDDRWEYQRVHQDASKCEFV